MFNKLCNITKLAIHIKEGTFEVSSCFYISIIVNRVKPQLPRRYKNGEIPAS